MSRASLPRLRQRDGADAVVAALTEHGGVIVEDMLPAESLARINAEVSPHLAQADPGRGHLNPAVAWFFGKRTRHLTSLAAKSRTFATDVLCHPLLLSACDALLGPSCARYQVNVAHLLDRGPGSEAQLLHRDELVWIHVPRPHPELQVASITALVDFRAENGATRVVPGSHRWPLERQPEPHEIADAEMPAGASVLYLGSTIHGGGANGTRDTWRRGLHLSYVVGWLRTEENHYLGTPLEVARALPRQAQELLGYAVHDAIASGGGYLGAVDLRDPVDMLEDGSL
jgi:ectoine hydroxylase-related dioxygenase (phytanoyl-CoA dioxygenase family)